MSGVIIVEDEGIEKEYTIMANIKVVAFSEKEAMKKAMDGEILDVDIVDVMQGIMEV